MSPSVLTQLLRFIQLYCIQVRCVTPDQINIIRFIRLLLFVLVLFALVLIDQAVDKHGLPIRIKIFPLRIDYLEAFVLEQDTTRTMLQCVGKRILLPGSKAVMISWSAVDGICFHNGYVRGPKRMVFIRMPAGYRVAARSTASSCRSMRMYKVWLVPSWNCRYSSGKWVLTAR